ncbi:lytic polysaccharide monooxygenase [Zasmidium cellare ATCC 36951]|uniref:Lytic polysaccharide monooxygenase n=1 Tax=Zasmidium cellare ATCC 36951 TaxID=1080233 RepID=A0A6A6C1P0_ZASCE|nr:lytic polysaccharide monooxygenase [Zasmidium cellare ATCC 36951]KAF2159626.1 lytic polysaccharide monooxygenase [Zasmidium cellare ATCC 36951]
MPSIANIAALAALSAIPLVSAHGYIDGITSGGTYYSGTSPNWVYNNAKPDTAGWYAKNQDNGFVAPSTYANGDITCHKEATVGGAPVPVAAGDTIDLTWNTWPESHHGPVINYLAAVDGQFSAVSKGDLQWFKIAEEGLIDGSTAPGKWATDTLIANNNTGSLTIPSDIKPGKYVLRHEIIALHSAGTEDGTQNYPQCINVEVTGSGTASPCADGTATCKTGTELYTSTDAGILVNIYQSLASYEIPGPALYGAASNKSVKRAAMSFRA